MKNIEPSGMVFLAESGISDAGRGIFAKHAIYLGDIIEVCPVIEVPLTDSSNDDNEGLQTNYCFDFGDGLAVALGFGSLYNHSYEPNATYVKKPETKTIEYIAIKNIEPNEEITVNYNNGDPHDKSKPMNKGIPPAN
jgi:uncharacterized protein